MASNSRAVSLLGIAFLVVGVCWWWFADPGASTLDTEPGDDRRESVETLTSTALDETQRAALAEKAKRTVADDATSETADATGSLTVKVLFGEDRARGVDVGIGVRYYDTRDFPRRLYQRTDATGSVRYDDLRPGKIWIRHDRRSHEYERAEVVAGEHAEVVVHLTDGVDVRGVVVNAQGFPVPGATLLLTGWASSEVEVIGTADAEGRFSQRQVGSLHNLGARAPGYAPSPMHRCAGKDGAQIELRIVLPGRGGGLHGIVRGPGGEPLADLVVRYGDARAGQVATLPDGSVGTPPRDAHTFTDADGAFRFTGLAPGSQSLVVDDPRFAPYVEKTEVTAGTSNQVEVQLTEGVTCHGVVRDAAGEPAARISVSRARTPGQKFGRRAETGADGAYRITGLPEGPIELRIRDEKRGNAEISLHGRAGDVLEWSPQLSRGHVIEGVVRGKDGAPVHRATLQAMVADGNSRRPWVGRVSTDEAGEFALIGVPEDARLRIDIRKTAYVTFTREVTLADSPLRVQLTWEGPPTARILGTILDPEGKPVNNASITVIREGGDGWPVYTTKADGKIEINKRRPGTYSLVIRSTVYPRHQTEKREVRNGEALDFGDVQLESGGRVQVTLASDAPIPKKRIYLHLHSSAGKYIAGVDLNRPERISDPAPVGRYELRLFGENIIPVVVPVTIDGARLARATVPVRIGTPRIFTLHAPDTCKSLDLTITGPDGFRTQSNLQRSRLVPFTFSVGLPPGKLRAVAVGPQGLRGEVEFEIEAGDRKSARLRVDLR